MKGDFSRDTFDPGKHFSRVLQQQGRVQLDANSREQTEITLHYLRSLAADLIGPFAGPAGSDWGFKITKIDDDFKIGAGRYYVDGILCENEKEMNYKQQRDFPHPPEIASGSSLFYLDVWERHITALEDDSIREKALGGPDTATRAQVVWQVKIDDGKERSTPTKLSELQFPNPKNVRDKWADWIERWQPPHRGCLSARVDRPEDSNDPCLTAPDAKYRGQENQLYRVEIHQGGYAGGGGATFKWSRDNGAIVSRVEWSGAELIAEKPQGFAAGNWVELSNDKQELRGQPGKLVKLLKVEGDRFTLESVVSIPADVPEGEDWPTKARRWDQQKPIGLALVNGAVPLKESKTEWIEVENGIQIQFLPSPDETTKNIYRTGDYWLIPARVATGGIEWPVELDDQGKAKLVEGKENPIPRAPFGIQHHYAPLAILGQNKVEDCRCQISTLNSCKMPSAGEEGIGGHPICAMPTSPS